MTIPILPIRVSNIPNDPANSDSLFQAFNTVNNNFSVLSSQASTLAAITAGNGISVQNVSAVESKVTNTGVTSITAGTGIVLTGNTGDITISSTGGGSNGTGTVTSVGVSSSTLDIADTPIVSSGVIRVNLPDQPNVTSGSYSNPNITVDTYGRVVNISNGGSGGTVTSIAMAAGPGINIVGSNGVITTAGTFTVYNTGVTSIVAGTGIALSGNTGQVTISSTGGGGGGGTVSSVDIIGDANMTVSGGPITSVGSISLALKSNIGPFNEITANSVVANRLTGPLVTAAQPNVTSVGTLTSLTATGNVTGGNIVTGGAFYGALSVPTQANITTVGTLGNLTVTSNISSSVLSVSGNATAGNITTAGNISGANISSGNVTVTGNVASERVIANIINANTLVVSNLTANTAATVTVNAQPNITSVGTLTSLSVNGDFMSGNISTSGTFGFPGGNIVNGNITLAGGNISSGNVTVTGSLTGNLSGNGANITSINASSITSGALNQTLLGTANITINGNLISLGNSTGTNTIKASTTNQLTFSNVSTGSTAKPGDVFDGGNTVTIAYDSIGALAANGVNAVNTVPWAINISGSANAAITAGTVTSNYQPIINRLGNLIDLTVNGAVAINGAAGQTVLKDTRVMQTVYAGASNIGSPVIADSWTTQFGISRGNSTAATTVVNGDYIQRDITFAYTGNGNSILNGTLGYAFASGITTIADNVPTNGNSVSSTLYLQAGNGVGELGLSNASLNGNTGTFTVPKLALSNAVVTVGPIAQAAWVPIVINGTTYKLLLGT